MSGYLLSQWSLSEYRGVLRVVSTETPAWWGAGGGETESFLTTLRQRDGALVQAGRIGGLGKGERVYAVRFVGDIGYVVTFRQIDPLYTLDLADPGAAARARRAEDPRLLRLPAPDRRGPAARRSARTRRGGPPDSARRSRSSTSPTSRRPKRLHSAPLGQGWSEAESDHHAFLFWPQTGLVVVPFEQQAAGFRVGRARGIDDVGPIEHEAGELAVDAGDPALARRPRHRAHGLGRGRQVEQPRDARRARLGGVPAARSSRSPCRSRRSS